MAAAISVVMAVAFFVFRIVSTASGEVFVVKVYDGDTILLSDSKKVRYIGIDSPECGGYKPLEYFGEEARTFNELLVLNKSVRLLYDVEKKDRYGRSLAYVYVGDIFVNREMVINGMALAVPYPPNLLHQDELCQSMDEARAKKAGLWAKPELWILSAEEAKNNIGLSKAVRGKALFTERVGGGVYLNFDADFSRDFTVYISKNSMPAFLSVGIDEPEEKYRGEELIIIGTIHERHGPLITVSNPCQILPAFE